MCGKNNCLSCHDLDFQPNDFFLFFPKYYFKILSLYFLNTTIMYVLKNFFGEKLHIDSNIESNKNLNKILI